MNTQIESVVPNPGAAAARLTSKLSPVSIVLVARNAEAALPRVMQAIVAQDYPAFEVIVVDDGSRDHTSRIAQSFAGVRLLQNPVSQGVAAARNAGMAAASHEVIYLLDADCVIEPGTLRSLVTRLVGNPRIGVVSGSTRCGSAQRNLAQTVHDLAERVGNFHRNLLERPYTTLANTVLRRAVYRRVGGLDDYWGDIQDFEFTYRAHRAGYVNLFDASICVVHDAHRESLRSYYARVYHTARRGTEFRLRNRPALPFSRYLTKSLPLFVLLSPVYLLLHVAKVCAENVRVKRVPELLAVLPLVIWSRAVYTAGSIAGCAAYTRWKRSQQR